MSETETTKVEGAEVKAEAPKQSTKKQKPEAAETPQPGQPVYTKIGPGTTRVDY